MNSHKGKNVNHQKLIIFEGFWPNGLQIRNQRILLHMVALGNHLNVKFDISAFFTTTGTSSLRRALCHYDEHLVTTTGTLALGISTSRHTAQLSR